MYLNSDEPNDITIAAMKESEEMIADPNALKFDSVQELFDELRTEIERE